MTWPQLLLAACVAIGSANAVRQGMFATAAVSPRLAALSALAATTAAIALLLLRRRHRGTSAALALFAVTLPVTTIVGTQWLLGSVTSLPSRLPGYFLAIGVGLAAAWGGTRELSRSNALNRATMPAGELNPPMPDYMERVRAAEPVHETEKPSRTA